MPSIDSSVKQQHVSQSIYGFPTGYFLIRSHYSHSLLHGRRVLKVAHDDNAQASEIVGWVDESNGEMKEGEHTF
jgi:hypothetical protein